MKKIVTFLLLIATLLAIAALPSFADSKMAYNIYSNGVNKKYTGGCDTYLIDFKSDDAPNATYWALANYSMYLRSEGTRSKFKNIKGGGAYCGLQNTGSQVAIMSFWEWSYGRKEIHNATRIYPAGKNNTFGGEGEGVNWIAGYDWEPGKWYRMALHSWQDAETGTTMAGTWYKNIETGKWKLFCYYDTGLVDSYMVGNMSFFMENFSSSQAANVRTVCLKNMYVYDHTLAEWLSMDRAEMSTDAGATNKKGIFEFGSTDEYFFAKTDGTDLPDQAAYMKTAKKSYSGKISQPAQPALDSVVIDTLKISESDGKDRVSWTLADTSAPQQGYTLVLKDEAGNTLAEKTETRPEVNHIDFEDLGTDAFTATLTVTDIFGGSTTADAASEGIGAQKIADTTAQLQAVIAEYETKTPADESKEAFDTAIAAIKNALANGFTAEDADTLLGYKATLENDIVYATATDSVLPAGSLWIIIAVAVVVLGGVAALIIVKKKKKN